ncbi:MAG: hypothetical protein IJW92_05925 [Clostridia bacterium]|nr:hypothetical protein [Clostridia bacterium]
MRKTYANLLRVKVAKGLLRGLVWFAVIQIVILAVYALESHSNAPISITDLKSATITVDQIGKDVRFVGGSRIYVVSDSVKYTFSKSETLDNGQYTKDELQKAISVGDELSIRYKEEDSFFTGSVNYIYDATMGDKQLRSIETHNQELINMHSLATVCFVVVEIIFSLTLIVCACLYISFNWKGMKLFQKRKH